MPVTGAVKMPVAVSYVDNVFVTICNVYHYKTIFI
jgi:hypothetical protein